MHFRQLYFFIIIIGLIITGCEKLTTDPGDDDPNIESNNGLNYWGSTYNDFGQSVYETADGGYAVVGSQYSTNTQEDLVLVKFNSSLEFESSAKYSAEGIDSLYNNTANDIMQTADGGYITVGSTFNGLDYDVLVVKFSPLLAKTWQDTIKGNYDDVGNSIHEIETGYIVCGTSYDGNDDDIMLWKITVAAGIPSYSILYDAESTTDNETNDIGNHAIPTSGDGGYIILGTNANGMQVTKLKANGTPDSTFATNGILAPVGSAGDQGAFIQQLQNRGYIVAGKTEGGAGAQSQVYLNTISQGGASVITRTMGGTFDDGVKSIIPTHGDGGFAFTGYKYNDNTKDNIWIVKLTATLTTEWDKIYGGEFNDNGASIMQTDDGGYIITGSTMSFGNQSQIILLKIQDDGCVYDNSTQITCGL